MKAVIYTRYSTDQRTENSTITQINECKEFANKKGLTVVNTYSDEAISGMKMQRNGLQQLLIDAENHKFNAVIIYDQSRLSRDIVDWFTLRKSLEILEIDLYSALSDKFGDVDDPTTFMLERIQAIFNQMHVLTTKKKVTAGLRNIAKQGLFAGGSACLGYDIVDKNYIINEIEAQTVRVVFEMYSENKSYNDIINFCNVKGFKTKAGKTFDTNSLSSILRNERYIGFLTHGKILKNPDGSRNCHKENADYIRIENAIPIIISKEVWGKVQVRLHDNTRKAVNKSTTDYFLSGKIFCGCCVRK